MKRYTVAITVMIFCLTTVSPGKAAADRLIVVASVFPLYDFAREVAGTDADVKLLLPPGVDPHSWEPRPSDILDISRADIFLYTSDRMEPWAGSIAKAVSHRNLVLVQVMEELDILQPDPHFWMDLSLSVRAVEMIGDLLADRDPDNMEDYKSRAGKYAGRLWELDRAYRSVLANCSSRQLVTGGHAAFGYLAERYGLQQVSVYGLSSDAEPSPRRLAEIVNVIRENRVQTIFSEELMNPKMAQVLSEETGAKVLVLNPGGNLSADQWREGLTYIEIVGRNLNTLREGLGCE